MTPSHDVFFVFPTEPFSTPTITVRPSNNFTEGAVMEVTCTVQKSYRRSEVVSITLQKGNQILNASNSERLTYSQVATVSDMGNYTCKAEGRTASKTTSAMVKVKGTSRSESFIHFVLVLRGSVARTWIVGPLGSLLSWYSCVTVFHSSVLAIF